ncbi:MAG TPA: PD-(D/E)XK nuclease family protein [Gammaproteobacteria bacterium]|nr:PD-(D/E)XK nuclease family protein [Gammaproteobacteria bacterium]
MGKESSEHAMEALSAEDCREALDAGALVITATRRLARAMQADYARASGADSWATPAILPWSAWVQSAFRELRDFGRLEEHRACLSDGQSAALWEQLLAQDEVTRALLMPSAAVESFREAWALAHEWRLPWAELQARGGEDCRSFLRIARAYERRLAAMDCLDTAQLPALLAPCLGQRDGPQVLLAGFDTLTPVQQQIMAAFGERARRLAPPRHGSAPRLMAFADERAELAAAATWARDRLEQDPAARLAIVIPDLGAQGALVEGLLDEALAPRRMLAGASLLPRPWNVSLGAPLLDTPAVAAVFLSLGLIRPGLETLEVGRLLRSPFIAGAASEAGARARLDAWAREHAGEQVGRKQLLRWLAGAEGAPACPVLAAGIEGFLAETGSAPRRRRPSEWAAALARALKRLGWPGETPPDSATWQAVQAWAGLLDDLAGIDAVSGRISLGDAVARLRRLAAERRFQPETPALPVQVLGLLETAGLEFDATWVSGLHDGVMPAGLRPCPLLPAAMQRERRMPRACPDAELAHARHTVERLAASAPEVVFSYPEARADEPLRPSPVLSGFPVEAAPVPARQGVAAMIFEGRRLEARRDEQAPPLAGAVRGGTGVLSAQSSCPFQAFAVYRLHAEPLETPTSGVDPRTRGALVHQVLHALWGTLRDRDGLAGLDAASRLARVEEAVNVAAAALLAWVPRGLAAIEREETVRRILQLLALELERPDFRVLQREQRVTIELGPLSIRGQADRVDQLAEGVAVIDYKTGAADPARWEGERPADAQMPVYSLAFGDELVGLAYASLKPGEVGFYGRAMSAEALGPLRKKFRVTGSEEWQAMRKSWREVVERLAQSFSAGHAAVDPLRPRVTGGSCTYCHLGTLCRRDELLRAGVIGDD